MIIDSSIILAIHFDEAQREWAIQQLERASRRLMSTVNFTECLIRTRDRNEQSVAGLEKRFEQSDIELIAPDVDQCRIAASARFNYPLNFGDCFAYALAKSANLPLLTFDTDFLKTDVAVIHPSNVRG